MVKKNLLIKIGAAVAGVVLIAGIAIAAASMSNKGTNTNNNKVNENATGGIAYERESTTATDLMAVTITDKNGNSHVVEGVGVTDESGKTTITVTDDKGNETVIVGKVETDSEGKKTVTDATVVTGGEITTSKGDVIDTTDATVGSIEDNNSGDIETDVSVSDDKKAEVAQKQTEAAKVEKETSTGTGGNSDTETSNGNNGNSGNNSSSGGNGSDNSSVTEKATEKETEKATAAPTTAPTTAPVVKPTQAATQTPAVKPTEAVTKPLTKEEKIIADCEYADKGSYVRITDYTGTESDLVIPSYIDGKPVTYVKIGGNPDVKSITLPDTATDSCINNCQNLEVLNIGKGQTQIRWQTVLGCSNLKEVNLLGKVTLIEAGWVTTNTAYTPFFTNAVLNIHNSMENVTLGFGFNGRYTTKASECGNNEPLNLAYNIYTARDLLNVNWMQMTTPNVGMWREVNFID